MTLAEIKKRQSQRLGNDIYMREINWLIAEVEKWQNRFTPIDEWVKKQYEFIAMEELLNNQNRAATNIVKLVIENCLCEQKTAERCAEIVEHEVAACSHPQSYALAIRKEFDIAK